MGGQVWLLGDYCSINIGGLPALFLKQIQAFAQKEEAGYILVLWVSRWEMKANVPQCCGSQKGVYDSVGQDVGITVAG